MGEQSNSKNRSRNAAHRQSENHFTPDCALVQMHPSRRYFREEIEQSVRTDGYDGGNSQTENQYGEQENAAPNPVSPIRVPTRKPMKILTAIKGIAGAVKSAGSCD